MKRAKIAKVQIRSNNSDPIYLDNIKLGDLSRNIRRLSLGSVVFIISILSLIVGVTATLYQFFSESRSQYQTKLWVGTEQSHLSANITNPTFEVTELNRDLKDLPTVRLMYTGESSDRWRSELNGEPGDNIAYAIYYHNSGRVVARDVRVSLNLDPCQSHSCIKFNARIWGSNAPEVRGSATLSFQPPHSVFSVDLLMKKNIWKPNQTQSGDRKFEFGQSGTELFTERGILLGDIQPGWGDQGSVIGSLVISRTHPKSSDAK